MKRFCLLAGCFVVAVIAVVIWSLTTPSISHAPLFPVKPASGAAVYYQKAFEALPKLTEEERKLLDFVADQPIDTEASRQYLAKVAPSLKLLDQGARESEWECGLDLNMGGEVPEWYVDGWITLAKILRLKAKLELDAGEVPQAMDDLLMGFHIGKQIGELPLFSMTSARASTDSLFINLALGNLCKLNSSARQKLIDGIRELPPAHSIREVLAFEKQVSIPYLERDVLGINRKFIAEVRDDAPRIDRAFSKAITISPRVWLLIVGDVERLYNRLDALFALPPQEARPKLEELERQMIEGRFIGRLSSRLLRFIMNYRSELAISETQWAIFRTVINEPPEDSRGLREKCAKLNDPYDGQPIELHDVEGGVEIRLKSPEGKKPVTLFVQLPQK